MKENKTKKRIVCPYCKNEISELIIEEYGVKTVSVNKTGKELELDFDIDTSNEANTYDCPICHKPIVDNKKDAISFLNGKDIKEIWKKEGYDDGLYKDDSK
ncbi:MAG: hypothetical protein QXV17_05340 [Candidatus Micrarchaeaceae archaeon]